MEVHLELTSELPASICRDLSKASPSHFFIPIAVMYVSSHLSITQSSYLIKLLHQYCLRFAGRINDDIHVHWFGQLAPIVPLATSAIAVAYHARVCGMPAANIVSTMMCDMAGKLLQVVASLDK
jgi:hypothetical protein